MRRVIVLPDAPAMAAAAAEEFARAAAASSGPFRVALSGGSTPKALYALLADEKEPYRARVPWERLHFFWGDERCVPPDHADSNYRMALEALLSRVPVPPERVHRIEGELADPERAAERYEETLVREFDGLPRFDWIFLGMGPDGHTASLFPGTTAVAEIKELVTAVWVEEKKTHRLTLTFPVLNAAAKVAFLVVGADKAETARAVLEGEPSPSRPASLVLPARGELLWLLDRAAAGTLVAVKRLALFVAVSLAAAAGPAPEPDAIGRMKDGLGAIVAKIEKTAADPSKALTVRDLTNAAMGELALGGDPARAENLLRLMFAQQDMDAASPGYGTVPWAIRGATVTDSNAIEFTMQAMGPLLIRYGGRLSPEFLAEAPAHLKAAVAAIDRHRVPIAYTNIDLMKTTNLILLGRVLKDPSVVARGEAMLDAWLEQARRFGIAEYDSPTYYKVDANDLDYGFLYAEKSETRQKFKAALDLLWTDIARNFFPGRGSLSGPHSRDYDFLTGRAGIDAFFAAYGWTPPPNGREELDAESVALFQSELDGGYRPGPKIVALTRKPERWVASVWGDQPGQDRTNYLTRDFAIGGASHDYCPYDKNISIQLSSPKALTDISVVVDDSGEPYGKREVQNPDGHSKPRHLPSRPVTVQKKGFLLATFDAAPDKKRPSLRFATNVLLPLSADRISVNGNPIDATQEGEVRLSTKDVVAVQEGNALALVRVFSMQACPNQKPRLSLTIDPAGLKYKTARIFVSHHDPAAGNAPDNCRARTVILFAAVSAGDGRARSAAIQRMTRATMKEKNKNGVWSVLARWGGTTLEISRDLRAKTILKRAVDGVPAAFGPSLPTEGSIR